MMEATRRAQASGSPWIMTRRVYLDHNATTPLAPEVFEAMRPYWFEDYGNASSIHWHGQRARAAVEEARLEVSSLIGADPGEIVFTSGGTEGDNTAIFGAVEAAGASGRKHVVTTSIEHHAVLHSAQALESRGVRVTYVAVGPGGVVDPADVERAIGPDTVLISVMHANNEIGTIQPVAEIGRLARERGIPLHTDAVQAAGKIPIDAEKLGADMLSLSAHKFSGPKGVGAMFVRKGTRLASLLYGGHHERDRRAGTENVPGIVGLGAAARLARQRLDVEVARVRVLRDQFEAGVLDRVSGVHVNGDAARRLPNTTNLRFDEVEGEALVIALDLAGIACSTGAACSSGSLEPSHVLAAIGLRPEQAQSSVRFSFGLTSTLEDVDFALEVLPGVVQRQRSAPRRGKRPALVT